MFECCCKECVKESSSNEEIESSPLSLETDTSTNTFHTHIERLHCLHLLFRVLNNLIVWISGFLLVIFAVVLIIWLYQKSSGIWEWVVDLFDTLQSYYIEVQEFLSEAYLFLTSLPSFVNDYFYSRVKSLLEAAVDVVPDFDFPDLWPFDLSLE
jgi:hypothetical protein